MKETVSGLWTAFGDRLRRFIAKRVRNEHDTDDILQEVFARIQASLDTLRSEEKLEPWLFQVTRRAVIDHFRKRSAQAHPVELLFERAEKKQAPDVTSEVASCLTPMMDLLEERDREVLRLADLEGLAQKDLAARLGLSLSGAKSRVQRARKQLKEALLECCRIEMDRRGNALSYSPRRSSCSCD